MRTLVFMRQPCGTMGFQSTRTAFTARNKYIWSSEKEVMGKAALKKYLAGLGKRDLESQIIDLYERFPEVKTYYDFAFNPKEEKLIGEAKAKITNEYFPLRRKRPRARRSVAQKYIRKYKNLGMDPSLLADLMLYNLETAQRYSSGRNVGEAFCKSMLRSFSEAIQQVSLHSLQADFNDRLENIYLLSQEQQWEFREDFDRVFQTFKIPDHWE